MDSIFEVIPMVVVLLIPIVAIIGGITSGIIKSLNRQRLIELAQKERIAAIEHGIDPATIRPIDLPAELFGSKNGLTFEQKQVRRSQLLMIWGLVSAGFGLAFSIMMAALEDDPGSWAGGMLFLLVGVALMLSSRVVRPARDASPSPSPSLGGGTGEREGAA